MEGVYYETITYLCISYHYYYVSVFEGDAVNLGMLLWVIAYILTIVIVWGFAFYVIAWIFHYFFG